MNDRLFTVLAALFAGCVVALVIFADDRLRALLMRTFGIEP